MANDYKAIPFRDTLFNFKYTKLSKLREPISNSMKISTNVKKQTQLTIKLTVVNEGYQVPQI